MKILGVTDHKECYKFCKKMFESKNIDIDFKTSIIGNLKDLEQIDIKNYESIVEEYDLIFSFHCKQIFPKELTEKVRCINIHPGYNPYNKGWFPSVWSIINGLPTGITIHEINEGIDTGNIIFQEKISVELWDTAETLYNKLMELERNMLIKYIDVLISGKYETVVPGEGNYNNKKDYERIRCIDLKQNGTFGDFINRLRALTHENYNNAYFYDGNNNKVFVKIKLEKEL